MSRTKLSATQRAAIAAIVAVLIAVVVVVGLILREYGPGNMGTGFLQGAAVGLLGATIAWWRIARHPDRATTLERAWTQQGDERDDAILTRALAVLGILAFPLTAAAVIVIALGLAAEIGLALLLFGEIAIFAVGFGVISARS